MNESFLLRNTIEKLVAFCLFKFVLCGKSLHFLSFFFSPFLQRNVDQNWRHSLRYKGLPKSSENKMVSSKKKKKKKKKETKKHFSYE